MIELRIRYTATLVLLAVFLAVAGVGSASARAPARARAPAHLVTTGQARKPAMVLGPFSGEPDVGGQSAPTAPAPKTTPTTTTVSVPTGDDVWLWVLWLISIGRITD